MARRRTQVSRRGNGERWTYWEIREEHADGSHETRADPDDPETTSWESRGAADLVLLALVDEDMVDPKRTHVFEITVVRVGS